ncbi:hypothetical protein NQ318_012655 [Aromia moschata]|uniref:THAP9-like helix-turn-helix domain-containing protein n=1 Tax=Aromia moschata TaxID=1265417 RepID=A0AAV8X866_9CUCU|nr:hypothetical protein NQ318_012655 [Aromia moschata]
MDIVDIQAMESKLSDVTVTAIPMISSKSTSPNQNQILPSSANNKLELSQSKYAQLLGVIEEMGREVRPTYAGSRSSAERVKVKVETKFVNTYTMYELVNISIWVQKKNKNLPQDVEISYFKIFTEFFRFLMYIFVLLLILARKRVAVFTNTFSPDCTGQLAPYFLHSFRLTPNFTAFTNTKLCLVCYHPLKVTSEIPINTLALLSEPSTSTASMPLKDYNCRPSTSTGFYEEKGNVNLPQRPCTSIGFVEQKTPPRSPVHEHSLVLTPRKRKLKTQLTTARRTIKRLRTSLRHFKKRAARLADVIKSLNGKVTNETLETLNTIGPNEEFLHRQMYHKHKYGDKLKAFSLTLHYYSVKAYNFVRRTFNCALPHPKTITRWYKNINGEAGFTTEVLTY